MIFKADSSLVISFGVKGLFIAKLLLVSKSIGSL